MGFLWEPSPRISLGAKYGRRDEDEFFDATLRHEIGPRTTIQARYTDERETDAERFVQEITGADIDDDGNFIDPGTGLPFNPNDPVTSFNNETTRTKSLRGSIQHSGGLNTIILSGGVSEETGGSDGDEDTYLVSLSWTRPLSRNLSFVSRAAYERNEVSLGDREDDNYVFIGALSYQLWGAAVANFAYTFQKQDSTDSDEEFTENTVSVGISISF